MTTLPVLQVDINKDITVKSNFKEFKIEADAFIGSLVKDPKTDADFATAKTDIKRCNDVEKQLGTVMDDILSRTKEVGDLINSVKAIREQIAKIRLSVSKKVKDKETLIKDGWVDDAVKELAESIKTANESIKPYKVRFSFGRGAFSEVIKGKRNEKSLKDAIDHELMILKSTIQDELNLVTYNKNLFAKRADGYEFLFNDIETLIYNSRDEFAHIVKSRIDGYKLTERDKETETADAKVNNTEYVETPAATFYTPQEIEIQQPLIETEEKSTSFQTVQEIPTETIEEAAPQAEQQSNFVDTSYIAAWFELKQELESMKEKEMEMRKTIAMSTFPHVVEGIFHTDLGGGYDLVCTFGQNYNVDQAALNAIKEPLRKGGYDPDLLVKYRPSLAVAAYKQLPDKVRIYFDQCLTIKQAAPVVTIKKRKNAE